MVFGQAKKYKTFVKTELYGARRKFERVFFLKNEIGHLVGNFRRGCQNYNQRQQRNVLRKKTLFLGP